MKVKGRLSPHQRIVRAAAAGRGVRLSYDECYDLGVMDDAIATRADLDDEIDANEPADDTAEGRKG